MKYPLIVSDIGILGGKPCIKNTRITVELIMEWVAEGASIHDISEKYPNLSIESIQQAIQFVSDQKKNDLLFEIKKSA